MYRRWRGLHGDDVHATADKFSREYRQPIDLVVRPAIYDRDAVPISVADFFQSLNERGDEACIRGRRSSVKKADHRHCRLLRPRRERPSHRPAA